MSPELFAQTFSSLFGSNLPDKDVFDKTELQLVGELLRNGKGAKDVLLNRSDFKNVALFQIFNTMLNVERTGKLHNVDNVASKLYEYWVDSAAKMGLREQLTDGGFIVGDSWLNGNTEVYRQGRLQNDSLDIQSLLRELEQEQLEPEDAFITTTELATRVKERKECSVKKVDVANGWGEVKPLTSIPSVQEFKLEFLPTSIQAWAQDTATRMSVPLDFTGICSILTLAGVINRRAFVFPKQYDKEWKESLSVSGAVIAPSGQTKTPTWKAFTNPMLEVEYAWRDAHQLVVEKYRVEYAEYERLLKLAERANNKKADSVPLPEKPVEPPPHRRILLNDATPESMHQIMMDNPAGVFVYRDEMSAWVAGMDQKGREHERGITLAAMNGNDPYTLDRIGRGSVSAIMSASYFGGFQPELLVKFLSDMENIDDGLIPRFGLIVWPDLKSSSRIDTQADTAAKNQYQAIIKALAELPAESVFLHFSKEAQLRFNDWYDAHQLKIESEDNSGKRSHLSKYKGLLPKLAGILQLADIVAAAGHSNIMGGHHIDLDHLDRAIALLAYLETHMHKVYNCILDADQRSAKALADKLKAGRLKTGFTARDVKRPEWKDLTSHSQVEAAIDELIRMNWIRVMDGATSPLGGRPTYKYEVNPAIVS